MKLGQKDTFYLTGSSKEQLEKSSFLEQLTKENYEGFYLMSKEGLKLKDLKEGADCDWWKKALDSEGAYRLGEEEQPGCTTPPPCVDFCPCT